MILELYEPHVSLIASYLDQCPSKGQVSPGDWISVEVAALKCSIPSYSPSTFRLSDLFPSTISSPNTSNIGSNFAAVSSSASSDILLRDLVPPRRRSRPNNQVDRSNSNEAHTYENFQSILQRNPWMGIVSTVRITFSLSPLCSPNLASPKLLIVIFIYDLHEIRGRRPPPGREWPFSLDWKVDKPKPVTEGGGLDGDQISSLTSYRYDPKKILVERILWLAHLTPAPLQVEVTMVSQARINQRIRAAQARAAAQLAQPSTGSTQPTPAASSTPEANLPLGPITIEVGSEETRSLGPPSQHQTIIPPSSVRSRDRPLNEGDLAETSRKRKSRGKSPLLPNWTVARSRSGEEELYSEEARLEEERNMDVLHGVTECWRTARLDLRSPEHPVARLEGDRWIPNWQISPRSSVFKTR
ncbi:UNVERIFIED_CONTAM: hypothetical protein Sindi_1419700 [Sesamum indicum]